MHKSLFVVAAGSLASVAAAASTPGFVFPVGVPLSKRQTSGPAYECHADCGYAIQRATGEYCTNSAWLNLLDGCLNCALEFDIWQFYGDKAGAAAEACGLDATPIDGDAPTSAAATTSVVETAVPETSAVETVVETTSAVETTAAVTTSAVATTTVASTTVVAVVTSSSVSTTWTAPTTTGHTNSTETGSPVPVPTAAASQVWFSGSLVAGAALAVAAFFV